jgi:hypothetical protein
MRTETSLSVSVKRENAQRRLVFWALSHIIGRYLGCLNLFNWGFLQSNTVASERAQCSDWEFGATAAIRVAKLPTDRRERRAGLERMTPERLLQ